MRARLTDAQRKVLAVFAAMPGEWAAGESWASQLTSATDRFAWHRHERTLDALQRRGLIDDTGITAAGLVALNS